MTNALRKSRFHHLRFALPCALLMVFTAMCHAHPGHGAETGGIGWGFAHPFTGLDHMLVALTVGMLAAHCRRPSLAAVFLCSGVVGGFLGAKMGAFHGLDAMLAASVLVLGGALAFHGHVARSIAYGVVAVGAAMHGWAHGSEATGTTSITGICAGTAVLVALGAAAAQPLRRSPRTIAGIGAGIATAGIAILAGIL